MNQITIDDLPLGQLVELAFCDSSGDTLYTSVQVFRGIEGEGEHREASFTSPGSMAVISGGRWNFGGLWTAHRHEGLWVYGLHDKPLILVRAISE